MRLPCARLAALCASRVEPTGDSLPASIDASPSTQSPKALKGPIARVNIWAWRSCREQAPSAATIADGRSHQRRQGEQGLPGCAFTRSRPRLHAGGFRRQGFLVRHHLPGPPPSKPCRSRAARGPEDPPGSTRKLSRRSFSLPPIPHLQRQLCAFFLNRLSLPSLPSAYIPPCRGSCGHSESRSSRKCSGPWASAARARSRYRSSSPLHSN